VEVAAAQFRLTSFVWESQPGRYVLTAIAHGTAKLAQGREATWAVPEEFPLGYDDGQTLAARMNLLAPFKPRADVVVVGKAYAPPGRDADRLVARVRLGDFSKAVSITGDRLWMKNESGRWGSSAPRPFSQMLLSPERSIRSAENPVGLDPAGLPVEGRLSLPNLEPVSGSYSAIIGPVPPAAPSRRNLLSPQGVAWVGALEIGQPPGAVAEGMNFAFFNVAPADQQLADITPGSAIVLENLHPSQSMFTSRLPTTIPRVRGIDPASGRPIEPQLRCDTVWIDGDRETAWLVFRGTVDLVRPDLPVSLSVEIQRWQAAAVLTPMATQTMLHTHTGGGSSSAPLPFAGQRGPSFGSYAQPEGPTGYSYNGPNTARLREETTADLPEKGSYPPPPGPKRSITAEILLQAQPQALPFGHEWEAGTTGDLEITHSGAGPVRQDTSEIDSVTPLHATEPPPPPSITGALPFADGSFAAAAPAKNRTPKGSPGPIPEISETKQPELPQGLFEETRGPISARGPSALFNIDSAPASAITSPTQPGPVADTAPGATMLDEPTPPADLAPSEPSADAVALQPAAPTLAASPPVAIEPPPAPPAPSIDSDPTPLPDAPEPPAPTRDSVTLEEAAAIRAQLSLKGADKQAVFAKFEVAEANWSRLEREHLMAIDEGVRGGRNELLDRYDDAFLASQDQVRGAIDGPGYAKIQVARERGQLGAVLEELKVVRGDLLRIDRVWRRRLATDRDLAERVEDEMERLRDEKT